LTIDAEYNIISTIYYSYERACIVDIRTLGYFVAVAEELSITRAAERLCISQPPLSSQMKNLEKELNTVLFIRGKRQLQLTDSGKLLYRRAKEILALTDKASDEIISMSREMSGTVSIGLVEGSAPNIAAEWIEQFLLQHPHVRFKIVDGNSAELVDKLRSGLISIAIVVAPFDSTFLNCFKVGSEKLHAFMSDEHPLASGGSTVTLEELKDQPLIVPSRYASADTLYKWFREVDAEPNIVCEMDNYLDMAALVRRNVGISLFPKTDFVINPSIVSKDIEDSGRSIDYHFVWLKNRALPNVEEKFIDFVKAGL